jgi:multidrug efflux system outer membrane protein
MKRNILLILPAILTTAGCTLTPDYERPAEVMPSSLGSTTAVQASDLDKWWERFGDPVLTGLVEEALANNSDLAQSVQRIEQARAALGIARADLWPSLSAEATGARAQTADYALSPGQDDMSSAYKLNALLSYEIDLFGRVRSSSAAAKQDLFASQYAHESLRSLIAAETANVYFNLVAASQQLWLAQENVRTRDETYLIRMARLQTGYGSDAELRQAEAELATASASLPSLRLSVEKLQSSLRILVGRSVEDIWFGGDIAGMSRELPAPPSVEWNDAPLSLLERRPDIVAAEASLKAANERIGVARAQRWPKLSLSALLGTADSDISDLFGDGTRQWNIAGAISGPIYDFGRSSGRIESAEAAAEIARLNYVAVVREAFKEVRDASLGVRYSGEGVNARVRQVDAWARNLDIARSRADAGYDDPLALLDAERGLFAARTALVSAKLDSLVSTISLYRSLGGGWTVEPRQAPAD